ncbi:hypothetical protein Tco_1021221, partial [Tanacetum coccineum]
MSKMSEDIWYAGSDTRPPMLDRTDFESWQQRICLYCLGKDNGENIMKSIMPQFRRSTSTDNLIESLTNTLALLNQSFKAHLPQMNNQLRTSSNARNNATVQDGRVVVQDVRGKYNANNQGRPFQRNTTRGNVVTGNAKGQNRDGNVNPGQAKPIMCYNCKGIGHI